MSDFQVWENEKNCIMKSKSFLLSVALTVLTLVSCEKSETVSKQSPGEVAGNIYTTESFVSFSKNFILDFKDFTNYFQTPNLKRNSKDFLNRLQTITEDDPELGNIFSTYSLSIDEVIARKNRIDNDFLQLFHKNPILLNYSDVEIWEIIRNGINLGWKSNSLEWQDLRYQTRNRIKINSLTSDGKGMDKVDLTEIWDCMAKAVGLTAAATLGIAGLKKLAKEGIQEVVISTSKWLAKRAGWVGAAIMVIDFSSCVYKESQD